VGNRFNSVPLSGTTTFARTTSIRCGAPDRNNAGDHCGAVWVWPQQAPMTDPVYFLDCEFVNSSYSAFTFWGSSLSNCHITNVTVQGGPHVGEVNSLNGNALFTDTVATDLTSAGTESCDDGFQFTKVSGCTGWDTTCCNCW